MHISNTKTANMLTSYIKKYPFSIVVAITITIISLFPFPEVKMIEDVPLADKWTHMVMYGVLSFVIWAEYLHKHQEIRYKTLLLFGFIAPIFMGGTLELMQAYLTTCRSGDWLDFVANSIGATLNLIIGRSVLVPWFKRMK